MSAESALIERLASSVSDGESVDWALAESSARDAEEKAWIRNLRVLADIGACQRSQMGSGQETGGALDTSGDPTRGLQVGPASGPAPASEARRSSSEPPARWGPLEIRGRIGEGGFGDAYLAWDPRIEREVALKLLRPDRARKEGLDSIVVQEGRLLARVRHPGVVTVHGAEIHDGRIGLWMEFIRGRTLQAILREHGPFGAREAAGIGIDLCRALAAVHGAGLIHGDIKAQNVMREEGGRIVLMDFSAGMERRRRTAAGEEPISGTPLYMAPETLLRRETSVRSDIYGLGVLLYHLVSEAWPVRAESLAGLRGAHERRETALLRDVRPELPDSYVEVVERALSWDPGARFASAGEMEREVRRAVGAAGETAHDPPGRTAGHRRLLGLVAAAGLAAAVIVGAALLGRPGRPPADGSTSDARRVSPAGRQRPAADLDVRPAAGSYSVEAALLRHRAGGVERLMPGSQVTVGDETFLEFHASHPLHVYVLNEDDAGEAYVLFPLRGSDLSNPLGAGIRHALPGREAGGAPQGRQLYWKVTSAGGREHLIVIASPEPIAAIEDELAGAPRPRFEGEVAYTALSSVAAGRLRGMGAVIAGPQAPTGGLGRIFDVAEMLAGRSEQVTGVWLRRIDLENPALR